MLKHLKKSYNDIIISKLDAIEALLNQLLDHHSSNQWIDGYQVMKRLGISKRTLQTYRTEGLLPYSHLRGIYFYKDADVDAMLERYYVKKN